MADYTTPTNTEFTNAEQVVTDILTTSAPQALTKTGSVIRELIIRPAAYLLSWILGNIDNQLQKTSVLYLRTSQATDNELADAVASNYFVSRRSATRSTGMIMLTLNTPAMTLPQGTLFTAEGVTLKLPQQLIVTSGVVSEQFENVTYAISKPVGSEYVVLTAVEAVDAGKIEIPAGTDITMQGAHNAIVDIALVSPVTGGLDIETDAQLIERAEYNTAGAGIGSYNGIRKRMESSPIRVLGMSLVAGEDAPLFRARYNNLGINPGGMIDMYVKTQVQSSVGELLVDSPEAVSGETVVISIPTDACHGFYRIVNVLVKGEYLDSYDVGMSSTRNYTPTDGARLSSAQGCTISFKAPAALTSNDTIVVTVEYMPGIGALQSFVDSAENQFIGQDVLVKAAIPVTLGLDCSLSCPTPLDDAAIAGIKSVMTNTVNSMRVGCGVLNFSDIREAVQREYPNVQLRLPCIIRARMVLRDGTIDTFYSNTGIVDLNTPVNSEYWDYRMCFFSLVESNIRITQIA